MHTSARAAGGAEDAGGGGLGVLCTPALVRPGLDLPGTHHFPGLPSHLENRVEPKASLTQGSPALPCPARARAALVARQARRLSCAAHLPGAAGRPRREHRGSARSRLGVHGYRRSPLRRPARQNTDRPDASQAGPGPHSAAAGEPTRAQPQEHGPVAWQPQLIPDGEPEARFTALGELGTHWSVGMSCSGRTGGAEGCVPARRSGCAAGRGSAIWGLNSRFICLTSRGSCTFS